jgi:hypothetical protein
MRDYGGPSRSPFWRTPEESCKGLGSVILKINTQHTHDDGLGFWMGDYGEGSE